MPSGVKKKKMHTLAWRNRKVLDLYSGGIQFESRLVHRLPCGSRGFIQSRKSTV
jgi:hypothetical protein